MPSVPRECGTASSSASDATRSRCLSWRGDPGAGQGHGPALGLGASAPAPTPASLGLVPRATRGPRVRRTAGTPGTATRAHKTLPGPGGPRLPGGTGRGRLLRPRLGRFTGGQPAGPARPPAGGCSGSVGVPGRGQRHRPAGSRSPGPARGCNSSVPSAPTPAGRVCVLTVPLPPPPPEIWVNSGDTISSGRTSSATGWRGTAQVCRKWAAMAFPGQLWPVAHGATEK